MGQVKPYTRVGHVAAGEVHLSVAMKERTAGLSFQQEAELLPQVGSRLIQG